ncbi:MAG: copper resistance D family protein [Vicinamibacterales bacterium]
MDDALFLAWLPKAIVYGLAQLAAGIVVVRYLAGRERSDAHADSRLEAYLAGLARVVAALLPIALACRLGVQSASAFGGSEAWTIENLRVIALESRWGNGWRLQISASAVLLLAVVVLTPRFRWLLFGAGAVGLSLVMPMLGHAAGSWLRYGIHAAHNLAAAIWIGSLGAITIASWRPSTRVAIQPLVRAFSPFALASSSVVFVSGAIAAWMYVGSWTSLWIAPYGRVLIFKLVGVALVVAFGWMNWRTVRRGRPPRPQTMTAEWVIAMAVLGLTGVLTETEHP